MPLSRFFAQSVDIEGNSVIKTEYPPCEGRKNPPVTARIYIAEQQSAFAIH